MKEEKTKIKSDILLRVRMLYLLFFAAGLLVLARLVWVQFVSPEVAANARRIESRIIRREKVAARRGNILSRDGEPLATSIFRYRVTFDFSAEGFDSLAMFREQSDSLAELLALYFKDRPAAEYKRLFRSEHAKRYRLVFRKDTQVLRSDGLFARLWDRIRGDRYRTVKLYDTLRDPTPVEVFPREVDYAEWQTLRQYPILNWNMGMVYRIEERDQRVYPQGELARRTIGLAGDRGNYGVEAVCRDALAGRDGVVVRRRIARGFAGRMAGAGGTDPVDGCDVVTTLDLEVQDVADKALRRQLEAQRAIWGTTLVMEVATGDLLAMVNLGRRSDGSYAELENYALGRRMEPGSTFKLAALLALLEDRDASLTLSYDSGDGRPVVVGKAKVQDSHRGYGVTDLKTATAQSLNVFYAKAVYEAYKDDPRRYVEFLKGLHLDRTVGLEAFGEQTPLLPEPGQKIWYPHVTLPNMGYGYAVELAPIHTLTLYNAVANGGRMVAPRLIREIRRGDRVVERFPTQVLVDRICSRSTLGKVRECLEEVAASGTAKYYFGDTLRLRVGAKTGTAKFAQGGIRYSDGYYLGTMAVYLPADEPRYTVLTSVFTRQGNGTTYYGAGLAGPVERQVAVYLSNRDRDRLKKVAEADEERSPERIKGGDLGEVRRVARSLSPGVEGPRGGWGRAEVDSSSRVRTVPVEETPDRMPDVRGMGLKDALFLCECRGLQVRFSGKGSVREQSIAPGARIVRGEAVTITLK